MEAFHEFMEYPPGSPLSSHHDVTHVHRTIPIFSHLYELFYYHRCVSLWRCFQQHRAPPPITVEQNVSFTSSYSLRSPHMSRCFLF